jgi:hypothetical protein
VLQALQQGAAVREQLHQRQRQVPQAAGVCMLKRSLVRLSSAVAVALPLTTLAISALGQTDDMKLSGMSLLNACRKVERLESPASYKEAMDMGLCLGAVMGTTASLDRNAFCLPGPMPRYQFVRIAIRYAEQHPEQQHWELSVLTAFALREAFPCRR